MFQPKPLTSKLPPTALIPRNPPESRLDPEILGGPLADLQTSLELLAISLGGNSSHGDNSQREILAGVSGNSFWRHLSTTALGDSFRRQLLATTPGEASKWRLQATASNDSCRRELTATTCGGSSKLELQATAPGESSNRQLLATTLGDNSWRKHLAGSSWWELPATTPGDSYWWRSWPQFLATLLADCSRLGCSFWWELLV